MKHHALRVVLAAGMLAGCGGAADEPAPRTSTQADTETPASPETPAAIPEPAPATPPPEPAPIQTSGDYGTDLAAAGVVPDDLQDYGQFMTVEICESPLTKHKFWDHSEFSESVRLLAAGPDLEGIAAIGLTVAYFCPERTDLAEEVFREHGYIK